jgi:UDP-glucose 4-epimerase
MQVDTETSAASGQVETNRQAVRPVIILGHSGFIGQALVRRLTADSNYRLSGYSLPSVDLVDSSSKAVLAPLFTRDAIVVMCAAVKRQSGDNLESYRRNLTMTLQLSELMLQRPIGRLIFMSSAAIYGEDVENLSITEETPPNIRSYYGLAKLNSEHVLAKVSADSGSELVCLRPPTIYGPHEIKPSYGPGQFLQHLSRREPIVLWGDGTELRGMVFVDDVVEIIMRLLRGTFVGTLNAASSRSYSFGEALAVAQRLFAKPTEVVTRERTKCKVDHVFRNERLSGLMPDFAFTDLAAGVRLTLERDATK